MRPVEGVAQAPLMQPWPVGQHTPLQQTLLPGQMSRVVQQVLPAAQLWPTAQHFPPQQAASPGQQVVPQGRFGKSQQTPSRQGAVESQQRPPQMVLLTPQQAKTGIGTMPPMIWVSTWRQASPFLQQIGTMRPSANSSVPQVAV